MPRLSICLLAPLLLAACEFPYDPWDEPQSRSRTAQVYLDVLVGDRLGPAGAPDTLGQTLRLNGRLMLDGLRDGAPRRVQRPEALLGGHAVAPRVIENGWVYLYEAERSVSWEQLGDSVLVVQPPLLEGVAPTPAELRFPLWTRVGGRDVPAAPGEDPVLRLRPPASQTTAEARMLSWMLQVSGSGGRSLNLSGSGAPPASIRIPHESLPCDPGTVCTALLGLTQGGGSSTAPRFEPGRYTVGGGLRTQVHWRIQRLVP